jgi:DNA end-binding protein Ku
VHYRKVVEGVGPVDTDDIRKGYEYDKGNYVLLEDAELDAVQLETRKTLDLVQFVAEDEIPPLYFDAPYFLSPADELAEDAFRVVRDALRRAHKLGLGQLALRGKEYLVAVRPCGRGLLLETLRYGDELRRADPYFSDVSSRAADADLLKVATALIDKKTAPFDPAAFKDHYQAALRELIDRKLKIKGRRVSAPEEPERRETGNVIDLMSALKKSLEGGDGKARRKPPARAAGKPRAKAPAKAASRRKAG